MIGRGRGPRQVNHRRRDAGVTMVEFALIAPLLFALVLTILIAGVIVLNDVELANGVRDGARAGGICGSQLFSGARPPANGPTPELPNGQLCTVSNLVAFTQSRITTIPGVVPRISVDFSGGGSGATRTTCSPGQKIMVTASYVQPLYAPLVGNFFGDPGNSTGRTITAIAEATCEQ